MSLKICFYASIENEKKEELDLLNYYKTQEKGYCIYKIEAGEICSEFIAKYFKKTNQIPNLLLNELIEENYSEKEKANAKDDMKEGIYEVNIKKMVEDSQTNTEIKTFKDAKIVREKLLEKYKNINRKLKEEIETPNIKIYATFEI